MRIRQTLQWPLAVFLFTVLTAAVSLSSPSSASAYSGTGYFTGQTGYWSSGYGGDVLPGRPGVKNAVPTSAYTKSGFISFIKNRLNSGAHARTGAGFIINTMLNDGQKQRSPSAARMADWEQRIKDPNVSMQKVFADPNNYGNGRISFYSPSINDVFFTNYNSGARELLLFKYNGVVKYVVEIPCGNPVGGFPGIPERAFDIKGDSKPDATQLVQAGQKVKFTHKLSNVGKGHLDRKLDAKAVWFGGNRKADGTVAKNCDNDGGLNAGKTTTKCTNTFDIPANASKGSLYCQRVEWRPTSSSNGGWSSSTKACYRVVPKWRITASTNLANTYIPPTIPGKPAVDVDGDGKLTYPPDKPPVPTKYFNSQSPGAQWRFRHKINNQGPDNINEAGRKYVTYRVQRLVNGNRSLRTSGTLSNLAPGTSTQVSQYFYTLPSSWNSSSNYCERLLVDWRAAEGNRDIEVRVATQWQCINGPVDPGYSLRPSVSLNPSTGVEVSTVVNVSPAVDNGGPDSSPGVQWRLVGFEVLDGSLVPSGGKSTSNPCGFYGNTGCRVISNGSRSFPVGVLPLPTANDVIPEGVTIGSKYCYGLGVRPHDDDAPSSQWRYSRPACATVGVKPRIQVWGHDTKALGVVNTSYSTYRTGTPPGPARTYGSWGEYGIFSNGDSLGMASGTGLLNGNVSGVQSNWSAMTFANVPQFGQFGGLSPFSVSENGSTAHGGTRSAITYNVGTTPRVYKVNGTLTINGNIVYANGTYTSIRQIPRVVFIADDINITSGATRIDAWLYAYGTINTCSDFAPDADLFFGAGTTCDRPLEFNGPVAAQNIIMNRTTDHRGSQDQPAERFNLRADAFLSAYSGAGSENPIATTDLVTELPPRF